MADTFERIKNIIVEKMHVDADVIKPTSTWQETIPDGGLNMDSLDTVELVMAIEEEFGIEVPDDRARAFATVADLVKYVEESR